jgi:thiol:disulfide interchange protein
MKKVLLILMLTVLSNATEIKWEKDLNAAFDAAEKKGKPLMVVMYKEHCRYCVYLDEQTLANRAVSSYVNKNYVAVRLDVQKDAYPQALSVNGTPATFILQKQKNGKYSKREKIMGFRAPMEFLPMITLQK